MSKKPIEPVVAFACKKVGSAAAMARHLGLTKQAVSQWKRIPQEQAKKVSALTGIPLSDLRPDIWGDVQ